MASSTEFVWSGFWVSRPNDLGLCLILPADGTEIELELDESPDGQLLRRALSGEPIRVGSEAPGSDILEVLCGESVLVPLLAPAHPALVSGSGVLARAAQTVRLPLGRYLSRVVCADWDTLLLDYPSRPSEACALLGNSVVVAARSPASACGAGCIGCAVLRAAPSVEPGWKGVWADDELAAVLVHAVSQADETRAALVRLGHGVSAGGVLPHPDCPFAALEQKSPAGEDKLLLDLASPFTPLALKEIQKPGMPFDVPFVGGDCRLVRLRDKALVDVSALGIVYGSGAKLETARVKALAEGVERLAALGVRGEQGSCPAWDMVADAPCRVSLDRVRMAWGTSDPGVSTTFTGVACHETRDQAVYNATVEFIVRDAYLFWWYRRRRLQRIEVPDAAPVQARAQYLAARGLVLTAYDLGFDSPLPMVLLKLEATEAIGNWPCGGALLVPGGGATMVDAFEHALASSCMRFVSCALFADSQHDPCDATKVAECAKLAPFWPLVARYLDPTSRPALAFLDDADATRATRVLPPKHDAIVTLEALRNWFTAAKKRWLVVRLTDVTAAACGWEVVRVVLPDLLRLETSMEAIDLDAPRAHMPWPDAGSPHPVTTWPHPLY